MTEQKNQTTTGASLKIKRESLPMSVEEMSQALDISVKKIKEYEASDVLILAPITNL